LGEDAKLQMVVVSYWSDEARMAPDHVVRVRVRVSRRRAGCYKQLEPRKFSTAALILRTVLAQ